MVSLSRLLAPRSIAILGGDWADALSKMIRSYEARRGFFEFNQTDHKLLLR